MTEETQWKTSPRGLLLTGCLVLAVATTLGAQEPRGDGAESRPSPAAERTMQDVASSSGGESWTRWGGPNGNFRTASRGLATDWPEAGPPRLWERNLGDGFSSLLFEDGRLFTMYRTEDEEVVVALDSRNGSTIWEFAYTASPREGHVDEFGRGPRSSPLLVGERIFTIGVAGLFHALDKNSGKLLWSKDLWAEPLSGNFLLHGYAASPIAFEDTVIVMVGGEGTGLVALHQSDGEIAWKAQDFHSSYSTPQVLEVDGELQLVAFMGKEVVGVDPHNGALKWRYPMANQFEQNVTMPTLVDGRYLFISAYQTGARGLKLTHEESGATKVGELWTTRKIQFYHATTVNVGDWIYGSTGLRAPAFMAAVNAKTGEIAWRERGFAKATCVGADGKLFILDEDGTLAVATATPEGLEVHSRATVLDRVSFTPPTIVGTTMYLRNRKQVVALDLGRPSS